MPVLEALHLAKSYNQRRVVEDVSFSVKSGEVVGILGPNGCGKTTCFYMVEGLIEPDSGHIRLDGVELTHEPTYFRGRKGIGYLPQEASVFRNLSVEDNIMAILETRRGLNKIGRREALEKLLQEFKLGHLRKSRGISLSGGERRRVEVARALAAEPSFMLLDEPFSGIDPISVTALKHIVLQLKQRGIGVLITDHNVRDTLAICDKAYIVCGGRIIAEGNSASIVNDPFVREVYLGENFRL